MMNSENNMKFLIAGGGTGGHIFTGIAMAEKIGSKYPDSEILFVGTKYGLEKNIIPSEGYTLKYILVRGLKGKSIFLTIRNLTLLPLGIIQAFILLKRFKPDVVFGVGGYASGPIGFAASKLGILLVIIEQNSIPGITNKILSKYASFAAIAFKMADKFLTCETILSGVPLRKEFQGKRETKRNKAFQILILGGSQGARGINLAIINALPLIENMGKEIEIIHQTGKSSLSEVLAEYEKYDVKANVVEFIENIHSLYEKTDVVVSRAGAITIAEIKAMRIPSILIPLPNSIYDHQYHNAKELADAGGAIILREPEASPEKIFKAIKSLMNPKAVTRMKKVLSDTSRPDAAELILSKTMDLLKVMERK